MQTSSATTEMPNPLTACGCGEAAAPAAEVRPLSEVAAGSTVVLEQVGQGKRLRERLLSMGLPPGVTLQVLGNRGGAVVVGRGASRIAIGRGMAARLLVRPLPQ